MLRPFCTTGAVPLPRRRSAPTSRSSRNAAAAHSGSAPQDLQAAYNLARLRGDHGGDADRGARRRVRRPDDRVGSQLVPLVLRPPAVHDGERLLQEGEPGRRAGQLPAVANPSWEPEIALDVEMVSAICPNCHILLVEANSADEAIATSNPVQHSDLGAAVDTAVNLGATEVSNSYGTVGPGAEPDLLRPLLQPSRRRDHRAARATRTTGRSGRQLRRT